MKALGFIEVSGVVAAVNALDTMCKTANVQLITWERKLGGRLVTLVIEGDVSAVSQAIDTAAATTQSKTCVHAVIARPHEETIKMVELSASRMAKNKDAILG